jgi:hypothetical protein
MPNTPLTLKVPSVCPNCNRSGTVTLEHTLRDGHIQLDWTCVECEEEWPVRPEKDTAQEAAH